MLCRVFDSSSAMTSRVDVGALGSWRERVGNVPYYKVSRLSLTLRFTINLALSVSTGTAYSRACCIYKQQIVESCCHPDISYGRVIRFLLHLIWWGALILFTHQHPADKWGNLRHLFEIHRWLTGTLLNFRPETCPVVIVKRIMKNIQLDINLKDWLSIPFNSQPFHITMSNTDRQTSATNIFNDLIAWRRDLWLCFIKRFAKPQGSGPLWAFPASEDTNRFDCIYQF